MPATFRKTDQTLSSTDDAGAHQTSHTRDVGHSYTEPIVDHAVFLDPPLSPSWAEFVPHQVTITPPAQTPQLDDTGVPMQHIDGSDGVPTEDPWDEFFITDPAVADACTPQIIEQGRDRDEQGASTPQGVPRTGPDDLNSSATSLPSQLGEDWDRLPEFDYDALSDGSNVIVRPARSGTQSSTKGSASKSRSPHSRSASGSPKPGARSPIKKKSGASSKKRRGYLAHELEKVNAVRRDGACLRCQILKEPCGDGCPCPRCLDVNATATVWRAPGFKGRITNVKVYRDRCMSYPEGMRSIDKWVTPRKLKIVLYHNGFDGRNHDPSTRPQLEIVVQNFVSVPTDVLHKQWIRNGEIIRHEMPAYAIPPKQKKKASKAIEACFSKYWDVIIDGSTAHQEPLVAEAFTEGKRLHKKLPLIHDALSIYGITCLISKSFNLTGVETLGIPAVDDPVSPYFGRIPIPMYLDTQLDETWESVMGKISKKLLSNLKAKILGRKKEHWYEVCLCLIILLANLETVYGAWLGQKGRYYKGVSEESVPFSIRETFSSWEHAADNILAHFQAVFNGPAPFFLSVDDDELRKEAKLDDESLAYVKRTRAMLKEREAELQEKSKSKPGDPLVWISRVFLQTMHEQA